VGYSDSDFAGDREDRKFTMGYVFLVAGGAIAWSSQKARSVATSTTEGEYIALGHAIKHAIWMRKLLADIKRDQEKILVYEDNELCLRHVRNPAYHSKTKHIDVQYNFVRDEVEKGVVNLEYCPTGDMLADGMTKSLPRVAFEDKRRRLGILEVRGGKHGGGVLEGQPYTTHQTNYQFS
jgi:hypothetical protein